MRVLVLCLDAVVASRSASATDPINPCSARGTDLQLMNKCRAQREAERERSQLDGPLDGLDRRAPA